MYIQGVPDDGEAGQRTGAPQLVFIHIHQLFSILYTLFSLDTVNIYWWRCINLCRVGALQGRQAGHVRGHRRVCVCIYIYI